MNVKMKLRKQFHYNSIKNNMHMYKLKKEVQDLYTENYRTWLTEIKEDLDKQNSSRVHRMEDLKLLIWHTSQRNLQIQCTLYQNFNFFFPPT